MLGGWPGNHIGAWSEGINLRLSDDCGVRCEGNTLHHHDMMTMTRAYGPSGVHLIDMELTLRDRVIIGSVRIEWLTSIYTSPSRPFMIHDGDTSYSCCRTRNCLPNKNRRPEACVRRDLTRSPEQHSTTHQHSPRQQARLQSDE